MTNSTPLGKMVLFILPVIFLVTSCTKEINQESISVKGTKSKDDNYYFNWETATHMPVSPSSSVQPPMPWQSQSGSYIDANLVSDYKISDGWDLVYNTFNPNVMPFANTQPAGGLYFALYNRFRGLLRFYLYIPSGLFGSSSNIEHGLSVYSDNSTTSKMLNFDGADIVDANINTTSFTKTNNTGVAVGGGWYAMQYKIAYDPGFSSTTYPHLGFTWNSRTVSISQIQLEGTQQGTINGNISQPSGGFNWTSALVNGILGAAEIYGTAGGSFLGTMGTNMTSAATGGLAGNVTGFFSGIFGGNSNNNQEVDLTMNTTLALSGSLTSSQPLVPNSLVFPGQTIANTVGAPNPLTAYPLGLFNLSGRPTVNETTTSSIVYPPSDPTVPYNQFVNNYTVDAAIFNSLFITNNNVINSSSTGATIQSLATQVELLNPNQGYNFQTNGTLQNIGDYIAYESPNLTTQYTIEHQQPSNNLVAVKVSFYVVPNNGAPRSLIVKTFLANLVHR